MRCLSRPVIFAVVISAAGSCIPAAPRDARAQSGPGGLVGIYASQARSAQNLVQLGVQQALSSRPPTAGQSFVWFYDPNTELYAKSRELGPTVLRTPQTLGEGQVSARVALSYLGFSQGFGPVYYDITGQLDNGTSRRTVTQAKVDLDAQVGIIDVGANYGLLDDLELAINFPVVIASVSNSTRYLSPNNQPVPVSLPFQEGTAAQSYGNGLADQSTIEQRSDSFGTLLGPAGVDTGQLDGTSAGLGRVSVNAKYALVDDVEYSVALVGEVYAASPNADQLAGSDTWSILPRIIGSYLLWDPMRLYADIGYEYDFEASTLRRFVWDIGAGFAWESVSFDFGFGGSNFNSAIDWTPQRASADDPASGLQQSAVAVAGDSTIDNVRYASTSVGKNFYDFFGGVKYRVSDQFVVSASVVAPLNDQGFRPTAGGGFSAEVYF